jgi:hypothetical protein
MISLWHIMKCTAGRCVAGCLIDPFSFCNLQTVIHNETPSFKAPVMMHKVLGLNNDADLLGYDVSPPTAQNSLEGISDVYACAWQFDRPW